MARPKIRPVSPEAAAAGQAAIDSFAGVVFIPPGAATYPTKNGTGYRWSTRLQIEKANIDVGGTKEKPDENIAVFYLMAKALPFNVDPDKAVPVGTPYHLRVRLNYQELADGEELAVRNQAVLTSLFAALGVKVAEAGLTEEMLVSAFPEKGQESESSLLGQRVIASLSQNPPKKNEDGSPSGTGFLNVDRFMPDVED